jgi:hypothetical protein
MRLGYLGLLVSAEQPKYPKKPMRLGYLGLLVSAEQSKYPKKPELSY